MLSILIVALSLFASVYSAPLEKRQFVSISDAPIVPREDKLCIRDVCLTVEDLKAVLALQKSMTVNNNGKVGTLALDKMTMGNGKWHVSSEAEVFVIRDKASSNAGKESRYAMLPGRYVNL